MADHILVRDAHVDVTEIKTRSARGFVTSAHIVVNDTYEHTFPSTSRVSKALELMSAADLSERLSGGSFFLMREDDPQYELVDFRDGTYNGFIHDDQNIAKFIDVIGYQRRSQLPLHRRRTPSATDSIVLRNLWSDGEIVVPGYKEGGEFRSQLSFKWNPFEKMINSSFDLVRLICSNGMVGTTNFLNTKIPLFNRWEEHLEIASRQIQNKINSTVIDRIHRMGDLRASVADCQLLSDHITQRLYSTSGGNGRLLNMLAAVSPEAHLGDYYKPAVFASGALSAQLPSHLTQFDAWNIATEVRTHTDEAAKSSAFALDRFANQLLFSEDLTDMSTSLSRFSGPRKSAFSDPNTAFYGNVVV